MRALFVIVALLICLGPKAGGASTSALKANAQAASSPWGARLMVLTGRRLSPETSDASLTAEPEAYRTLGPSTRLELFGTVDRPFDGHRDFRVPRLGIMLKRDLPAGTSFPVRLNGSVTALDLDRWGVDGGLGRLFVATEASPELLPGFTLSLRAGGFLFLSQYAQRADGRSLPRLGLQERLQLSYRKGRLLLQAELTVEQASVAGGWRNDYGTRELVGFRGSEHFTIGVMHQLVTGVVDDSTGFYRPVRFFDGRESRVSLFLALEI